MKRLLSIILSVMLGVGALFTLGGCGQSKFTVTFDIDGGTLISGNLVQQVAKAEDIKIPVIEKEGWTFVGWDTTIPQITEQTTVKALWKKQSFTVTFSVVGGTFDPTGGELIQTVLYNTELQYPIFTRDGYTLLWDKELSEINSSCTVNGRWAAKTYTISFVDELGNQLENVAPLTVEYGGTIANLPKLDNGEYKFAGWQLTSGDKLFVGQVYNFDNDVKARAIWTDYDKFVINVNLDGGDADGVPRVYTEGVGAVIESIARTGYVFKGWVETDENGSAISAAKDRIEIGTDATGDKYYLATWQAKSYTVKFESKLGLLNKNQMTFTYGQTIEDLPIITDINNTFVGFKNGEFELKEGEKWEIDQDELVFAAQFLKKFVITLNINGVTSGGKQVPCTLPKDTPTKIIFDEFSVIELPVATPEDSFEYKFKTWRYKDDGDKLAILESGTVLTTQAFVGLDLGDEMTINIELIAYCRATWTGYY